MATRWFRSPKTGKEETALLSETVPKNTKYNSKWAVKAFTAWQNNRVNTKVQLETDGIKGLESTDVEDRLVSCHLSTCPRRV